MRARERLNSHNNNSFRRQFIALEISTASPKTERFSAPPVSGTNFIQFNQLSETAIRRNRIHLTKAFQYAHQRNKVMHSHMLRGIRVERTRVTHDAPAVRRVPFCITSLNLQHIFYSTLFVCSSALSFSSFLHSHRSPYLLSQLN